MGSASAVLLTFKPSLIPHDCICVLDFRKLSSSAGMAEDLRTRRTETTIVNASVQYGKMVQQIGHRILEPQSKAERREEKSGQGKRGEKSRYKLGGSQHPCDQRPQH